jgi:hypothetical protein
MCKAVQVPQNVYDTLSGATYHTLCICLTEEEAKKSRCPIPLQILGDRHLLE